MIDRMRLPTIALLLAALASCAPAPQQPPAEGTLSKAPASLFRPIEDRVPLREARRNFRAVVTAVEPVAERICRERTIDVNCDFQIVVDDTVNAAPNAFQTEDEDGRPILGFTVSLIAVTRNRDELAFIMAHEAAHHIRGHLQQSRQNAQIGATIAGAAGQFVGALFGGGEEITQAAEQIGANIGFRRFSKDFELEADALGTIIAARAGFDPINGAQFFNRIPDPGNRFLGTHPPNRDRLSTVIRVASGL